MVSIKIKHNVHELRLRKINTKFTINTKNNEKIDYNETRQNRSTIKSMGQSIKWNGRYVDFV